MRILIVTRNAWDDTNSIGNTVSNFFGGIPDAEFANLYFRSSMPNNRLCKRYFQVTEKDVLRFWLTPSKIGEAFYFEADSEAAPAIQAEGAREKRLISLIHKYHIRSAGMLSNALWDSRKWCNEKLDRFIEDFAPDLMFSFVKALPQYYQSIRYLRERFDIPLLTWIADDEYTGYLQGRKTRQIQRLQMELKASVAVKGCSQEICDYYNSVFDCHATPLYKGCDLSTPVKTKTGNPLKIVYAGNLLFGRLEILRAFSEALEEYAAASGKNLAFDIYSSTPVTDSERQAWFGRNRCTSFQGMERYEVIKKRLAEADIVLLAEAFDEAEILKTRYSFSTKIVDYLQSGSVILAIGPDCLASIRYIRAIPGTFVIDRTESIRSRLSTLLDDAEHFSQRAAQTRAFAHRYHDANALSTQLQQLLQSVASNQRTKQ